MKIKEITAKKDKELLTDLVKLKAELTKLRFDVSTKETNQHTGIKKMRRDIAKIKTILKEREIQRMEEKDEKNA